MPFTITSRALGALVRFIEAEELALPRPVDTRGLDVSTRGVELNAGKVERARGANQPSLR